MEKMIFVGLLVELDLLAIVGLKFFLCLLAYWWFNIVLI